MNPAVLVAIGSQLAASTAPICESKLSGRVVDALTAEPLDQVQVTLNDSSSAETDKDGRFEFLGVCLGVARLRARRADYRERTKVLQVSTATAAADLSLEPHRLTRMSDVLVEAPRLAPSDTKSTGQLSGEALERTRGRHLADAVAEVPGVTVLRSGGTAKPIVRGQSGSRVLVLYDGVRHEGQDWGLNHGTEIDPFSAGSISVVKGAAGVRYGPDAIAGVLLVAPPPLLSEPGTQAELHLVGALNGRRGTIAGRVDSAPGFLPGLSLRVEGNFSRGRALETPEYPLDNTGIEEWNLGGKIGYRRPGLELELSFSHLDLTAGLCTCLRADSPGDFQAQIELERPLLEALFDTDYEVERPSQEVSHDRGILRGRIQTFEAGSLELTYAYQVNLRREFDIVRQSVQGPQADFELRTHSADLVFEQSALNLADDLVLTGMVGGAFQFQENVFFGLPLIPNFRSYGGGIFIIERLSIGDVDIEAGARVDFLERETFLSEAAFGRHRTRGTLDEEDCEVSGRSARCPSSFQAASLTFGAVWRATSALTAKLDFSTASRIPTIDEQYINGTSASFPVLAIGDPSLGPETSWSLSSTLQLEASWLSAEVSAYGSLIDEYIYFAPETTETGELAIDVLIQGAFPRFSYRAVDALIYGGEGLLKLGFDPFEFGLKGAVVRARDIENDAFLVFIPPDRLTASLTFRAPSLENVLTKSFVTLSGTFVARQDRFDENADFAVPPPGYFLLGAEMGTNLAVAEQVFRISLEGNNLLNQRYRDYTSLLRYFADEPGVQVLLRIATTIGSP